jgi:hypothetical protein
VIDLTGERRGAKFCTHCGAAMLPTAIQCAACGTPRLDLARSTRPRGRSARVRPSTVVLFITCAFLVSAIVGAGVAYAFRDDNPVASAKGDTDTETGGQSGSGKSESPEPPPTTTPGSIAATCTPYDGVLNLPPGWKVPEQPSSGGDASIFRATGPHDSTVRCIVELHWKDWKYVALNYANADIKNLQADVPEAVVTVDVEERTVAGIKCLYWENRFTTSLGAKKESVNLLFQTSPDQPPTFITLRYLQSTSDDARKNLRAILDTFRIERLSAPPSS